MGEIENIKLLLERLDREKLSAEELKKLESFFQDNNKDLKMFLSRNWDESGLVSEVFNEKAQFEILRNKLQLVPSYNDIFHPPHLTLGIKLRSLLKYATIFVVGVGFALILGYNLSFFNKKSEGGKKPIVVEVAYGSKSIVHLPDGSTVDLNSGSWLSYSPDFDDKNRVVTLSGEAYFDVRKDPAHPFYVNTAQVIVKAVGTSFNVKSYPDDKTVETTLISGKIMVYKNNKNLIPGEKTKSIAELIPNQQIIVKKANDLTEKELISNNGIDNTTANSIEVVIEQKEKPEIYTDWKDNILNFSNKEFSAIEIILERWYDVEIYLEYQELSDMRFSGKFDKESINEVLDALKMIQPFDYKISKNKILITKK